MLTSLNRKISPPVFADDLEKTRRASVLNAVLWICIGMVALNFVITVVLVPELIGSQVSSLLIVGVAAIFLYLLRRGWVRFSSITFLILSWLVMIGITGFKVAQFDSFIMIYPALVVMAGVLLGTKGAVGYSALCLGTIIVTVYLPNEYGYSLQYSSKPAESLLNYILTFSLLAALLVLSDYGIRQALHRVRDSEERLRLALEAAQLGDWRWNLLTGEIEWGDQVARIFGLQGDQKGSYESILSLIAPDYWPRLEEAVRQTGKQGDFSAIELEITRPDGIKRWVAAYGKPYRDNQGKVVRLIGMVQDITERKQAEQQVMELTLERERNTVLKEFISRVSHDLKNPLSVIYTSLDLLQRVQTEEQRDEKIRQIRSQANRLNKLIQDSLTIHRLDYIPTLALKPVRINSLLMELKQELHPIIERKQIHMEMALSMGLAPVNANEEEIRRALENLFENALNYTPDQGRITIRTASRDADTVVEFTDTGIGISPEERAVIFERFQRGDAAKRMVESGSGLGLAIVHRIVMMHQGQIEVESEVGKGSTFRITLPTCDEP